MKNEGNLLSMGYGFVEFKTREAALEAFKLLQVRLMSLNISYSRLLHFSVSSIIIHLSLIRIHSSLN